MQFPHLHVVEPKFSVLDRVDGTKIAVRRFAVA
jgi:hypothetical protein